MLTLHHLDNSGSQRILWLLEELGTADYLARIRRRPAWRRALDKGGPYDLRPGA